MSAKYKYGRRPKHPGRNVGTREVSPTYGKTSHPLATSKFDDHKVFHVEEQSEQLVGQVLDIDPQVTFGKPQGITVDLVEGELLRTAAEYTKAKAKYRGHTGPCFYTADFVAHLLRESLLAIEVKLDKHVGGAAYTEKLRQVRAILGRFGIDFTLLVIPSDQRHPLWTNVPLLCQARAHQDIWPGKDIADKVDSIAASGAKTASDFLGPLQLPANHLPLLVASGVLKADILSMRLTGRTLVEPAHGDLDHLRLLTALRS